MNVDIIIIILYLLIICSIGRSILKMLEHNKSKKYAMTIGRTGDKNNCIKDKDGFIVCKEKYSDINYQKFEQVGTEPSYKRPEPENECFYRGEKLYCRDPPFNPYSKYFPQYAKYEITNYPLKTYPYKHPPYSQYKGGYNSSNFQGGYNWLKNLKYQGDFDYGKKAIGFLGDFDWERYKL